MNFITSSKIFKSSRHKDVILAAAENPINRELIQQVAEYIQEDPEVDNSAPLVQDDTTVPKSTETPEYKEDESSTEPDGAAAAETQKIVISAPKPSDDDTEDEGNVTENTEPSPDDADEHGDGDESDSEAVESSIAASCCLPKIDIDAIQGLLNLNENTEGVNYILVRDAELWIHYNDRINLNDVMSDVIRLLGASNYTNLLFSRLARSDNAIVFDIRKYVEV